MVTLFSVYSSWNYRVYSETAFDARVSGGIHESKIHLQNTFKAKLPLKFYTGLTLTRNLSRSGQPVLTQNMVAPTVGASLQLYRSIFAFSEYRKNVLYKREDPFSVNEEFRGGFYAYEFHSFKDFFFNETYAELVSISRVSHKPVFVIWNKIGARTFPMSWLRADGYFEGFTRQSPDLNYGPTENEIRSGIRITALKQFWAFSAVGYYSIFSNLKPGTVSALFVLSREVF
jgi:hypothetical protein